MFVQYEVGNLLYLKGQVWLESVQLQYVNTTLIQLYEYFFLITVGETGSLGFLYQYAELNSKYWSVTDIWDSFTTFQIVIYL